MDSTSDVEIEAATMMFVPDALLSRASMTSQKERKKNPTSNLETKSSLILKRKAKRKKRNLLRF